jgi:hypothetical protein
MLTFKAVNDIDRSVVRHGAEYSLFAREKHRSSILREVLRLKFVGGVPTREIARWIGIAPSTVRTTIRRFHAAGLNWPLPGDMADAALEARLFSRRRQEAGPPTAGRAGLAGA